VGKKLPHSLGRARTVTVQLGLSIDTSSLLLLLGNTVPVQVFHPSDSIHSAMKIFPSAHCARDED
jgi:hypothetical protein